MCLVRSAAAAMNTSGQAINSYPPEWCSPNQASSNPRRSSASTRSMSYSSAWVGDWPTGWNGVMNTPKFSGLSARLPFDVLTSPPIRQELQQGGIDLGGPLLLHPVPGAVDQDLAIVAGHHLRRALAVT